jgi:DNA-binding transcriptional LysR family regulator
VDLDQIRTFLVLSEELSFGRTAARVYVSQPRVSRMVAALEREIGGALFERTSRHVAMTPLGTALEAQLRPAYDALLAAREAIIAQAREVGAELRIGVTQTSDCPAVARLADAFERRHPGCAVKMVEINWTSPYGPLRDGEVDILCNWLAVDEPDLHIGPVIDLRERVLLVGRGHRLAKRTSVSAEVLADSTVQALRMPCPPALAEAILPSRTPSGRPVHLCGLVTESIPEMGGEIASGRCVMPTVVGIARWAGRDDIIQVPITDLPPIPLGLIWVAARENARTRALAQAALEIGPGEHHDTAFTQTAS